MTHEEDKAKALRDVAEIIEEKRHNPDCRTCEGCKHLDDIKSRVYKRMKSALAAAEKKGWEEVEKEIVESLKSKGRFNQVLQNLWNRAWNQAIEAALRYCIGCPVASQLEKLKR